MAEASRRASVALGMGEASQHSATGPASPPYASRMSRRAVSCDDDRLWVATELSTKIGATPTGAAGAADKAARRGSSAKRVGGLFPSLGSSSSSSLSADGSLSGRSRPQAAARLFRPDRPTPTVLHTATTYEHGAVVA